MIKIKKFCNQCERELAESYEECPFCKGELEVTEVEQHVVTEEEKQQHHERAVLARKKQKKQQRLLAIAMCVLVLFGVASTARFADSEIPRSGEWFLSRVSRKKSTPSVPAQGIINDDAALSEFQKTYDIEFIDPIDFSKTSLIYLTTTFEDPKTQVHFIERVTANFMNTWVLYADGKAFDDQLASVETNAPRCKDYWVQGVHVVAVAKLGAFPSKERLSTSFSRRPPE